MLINSRCSNVVYTQTGGIRPKKSNFSLSKGYFSNNNRIIDTNFLYLNTIHNMDNGQGRGEDHYKYYRFYNTGQIQVSSNHRSKSDYLSFQNINSGYIGYYRIIADSVIFELFVSTNGGEYVITEGMLNNGM